MKFSSYHIIKKIGQGGNGVVYKARHIVTGQVVALKILNKDLDIRRLKNEVRLHASLKHPNIVTLLDLVSDNNKSALVLEYVEGWNLDEYIEKHKLTLKEKRELFLKILEPVEFLHSKNIIHRDLKFGNIKVLEDGNIKLLDFGISYGISTPKLTKEGFFVGTIYYTAPERIKGINKIQSDIWSLGVIYYEMLTGERLINGGTTKENLKILNSEKYTFSRLNNFNQLDTKVLKKCLRNDYRKRYNTIKDLRKDLVSESDNSKSYYPRFNLHYNPKWIIIPFLIVVALLSYKLVQKPDSKQEDYETCVEFKFYPKNAVLKLNNGKIIKGGDVLCGNHRQSFEGTLSAKGYRTKYVPIYLPPVKKRKQLYYTLEK